MINTYGNKPNRFFGPSQQHIKMAEGTFMGVEANRITAKLSGLSDIRIPYREINSSRVVLKAGETNVLLNNFGLGDNATFLAIVVSYDEKSVFEADNYLNYSTYSDKNTLFSFSQLLVLTGNSQNRIEQLYLHNPNPNFPVMVDILVANIDEQYSFFRKKYELETILFDVEKVTYLNDNLYTGQVDIEESDYVMGLDFLIGYFGIRLFDKKSKQIEDISIFLTLEKLDEFGTFVEVDDIDEIGWYRITIEDLDITLTIKVITVI